MASWWSWFQSSSSSSSSATSTPSSFTTPPTPNTSKASPLTPLHLDQSPMAIQDRIDFKAVTKQTMEQEQKSGPKKIFWPSNVHRPVLESLLKKHNYMYQFQPAKCPSCTGLTLKCQNPLLHAAWFTQSGYVIRW